MHFLAFTIELAAVVAPIAGILFELRRDISDDDEGGLRQAAPLPRPVKLSGRGGRPREAALARSITSP